MKYLLTFLLVLGTFNLYARDAETRDYVKLGSEESSVTIKTIEEDYTQAANYLDGRENKKFVEEMLKDKTSRLGKLADEIIKENCDIISQEDDTCGWVTVTDSVRTSFGRAGWASGGSGYTFFIGFTFHGTGRFFDVSHMITISETVEAKTDDEGNYNGTIMKALNLGNITRIDQEQP
jgi:hypothetical protein